MAAHALTTPPEMSGTCSDTFLADTAAFDSLLDGLHAAIDAEAFVAPVFFDPALSGFAHEAADAWASCETAAMRFLARSGLMPEHALAAEHLLDVLTDRGLDHARLRSAPVALMSAAGRLATRPGLANMILTRQLFHLAGLLRAVIDDSPLLDDPESVSDQPLPAALPA